MGNNYTYLEYEEMGIKIEPREGYPVQVVDYLSPETTDILAEHKKIRLEHLIERRPGAVGKIKKVIDKDICLVKYCLEKTEAVYYIGELKLLLSF